MSIPLNERGFGRFPDDPRFDHLDVRLARKASVGAGPIVTRNRDRYLAPIADQLQSNGCVGFSGRTAMMWAEFNATGKNPPKFSPMFGWAETRRAQGDLAYNVGCTIRGYGQVAKSFGICSEDAWPFEPDSWRAELSVRPSALAYAEASRHQILADYVVPDGDPAGFHDAHVRGLGVQLAIPVYESFFDTPHDTGVAPEPAGRLVGWHAVYSYDSDVVDGKQGAWCDNSWGEDFGKGGRFFLSDAWLRRTEDNHVKTKVEVL